MIDTTALLEELITAGTPARLVAQVATLVAETESLRRRRAADADRKRMSRDVRGHPVTSERSRDSSDVTPPAYTTPPREIKPKKVLSAKQALPTDFELSESDKRYAFDHGWTPDKLTSELARFVDHAKAGGRKQADWHAAWRNWVTSPFQASKANGVSPNGPPSKPSVSDILARLCDETSPDFDGVLPQVGRG